MAKLEDLVDQDAIHAIRGDGAKIIAIKISDDIVGSNGSVDQKMWEVLKVDKDGNVANDGTMTINKDNEPAIYRKTQTLAQLQKLADDGGYIEWNAGLNPIPAKEVKITRKSSAKQQEADLGARLNDVLEQVRQESPSDIQRIMVQQLRIGTQYYEEAARQSSKSFELARTTTYSAAAIFFVSVLVIIFSPTSWYVPITGSILATILQAIGQFSYLYNKASEQLASFHTFLDHISRSLFAYTMGKESNDQDGIKRALEQMLTSSEILKK